MLTAVGKSLFVDQRGRLWVVSREVDRDGTVAYGLAAVELRYVGGYRHKYEAVQAADHIDLEVRGG